MQVSSAQFFNTSSVHCIMCSLPQVKSSSITIYSSYNLPHLPHHHIDVPVREFFGFFFFFCFTQYLHLSSPYPQLSALSLFMSLFIFLVLTYFFNLGLCWFYIISILGSDFTDFSQYIVMQRLSNLTFFVLILLLVYCWIC